MAGTLLHITLAHEALRTASVDPDLVSELKTHVHDFRLGSVLIDLPYYDRLWLNGLRSALGFEIQYADLGAQIHTHSPRALALALLDRAATPPGRALALGVLTHIAVDQIFHAEIERRVAALKNPSEGPGQSHKRIEDQMDLHVHHHLLGHAGVGTSYIRRVLTLQPGPEWAQLTAGALRSAHGIDVDPEHFRKCLRSLALFSHIYSFRHAPWLRTTPHTDPELKETALNLATESIQRAAHYLQKGAAYLSHEMTKEEFEKAILPHSLADGSRLTS